MPSEISSQSSSVQNLIKLGLLPAVSQSGSSKPTRRILCKKCRYLIAQTDQIQVHEQGTGQSAFSYHKRSETHSAQVASLTSTPSLSSTSSSLSNNASSVKPLCHSLFVSPLPWISKSTEEEGILEGRIDCPKCTTKVGSFHWAGMQCSCGTWIAPAFSIIRSKVDS